MINWLDFHINIICISIQRFELCTLGNVKKRRWIRGEGTECLRNCFTIPSKFRKSRTEATFWWPRTSILIAPLFTSHEISVRSKYYPRQRRRRFQRTTRGPCDFFEKKILRPFDPWSRALVDDVYLRAVVAWKTKTIHTLESTAKSTCLQGVLFAARYRGPACGPFGDDPSRSDFAASAAHRRVRGDVDEIVSPLRVVTITTYTRV